MIYACETGHALILGSHTSPGPSDNGMVPQQPAKLSSAAGYTSHVPVLLTSPDVAGETLCTGTVVVKLERFQPLERCGENSLRWTTANMDLAGTACRL